MSAALFSKLDAYATSTRLSAGAVLFRRGDPVTGAYTLRRGKIALIWTAADGVTPMEVPGPGSIFGLPAVLNGEYSLSARTVEECQLGFLPVATVKDLLARDRLLMQELTKLLAGEVARMRSMLNSTTEATVITVSKKRK